MAARFFGLVAVWACAAGCLLESDGSAVGAARKFLQATQRGNCGRAFAVFSAERQAAIQAEFSRKPRKGYKDVTEFYCLPGPHNHYTTMDPTTAGGTGGSEPHHALVRVEGTDATGTQTLWHLLMVEENGRWRVHDVALAPQ